MEEEIFVELKRIISENRKHLIEMWPFSGEALFGLHTKELEIYVWSTTVFVSVLNEQKKVTLEDKEECLELFRHCKNEIIRVHKREDEVKKLLSILKGY